MGIVLDYTYRITPAALRAAGAVGVCRYLKPDSAPAYRITLAEYRELVAADIDVTLNWEYDEHDWLGGAGRGAAHGVEAVRQARALGYPAGKVIAGSADFDMTSAQWQTSAAGYAREFAAAVRAGGYRPGVYGPADVLTWVRQAGYMDAFWQCMSTSFSQGRNANPWPGAHLRQRGHRTVAGQDCDWNEILIPNWGADMEQGEKITGWKNRGNTIGDVFADQSNLRDWWYLAPDAPGGNPPPAGSRADIVLRAAQQTLAAKPLDLPALAAGLAPLLSAALDVAVSAAAVEAALQSPEGQAALVQAANTAEDS